MNTPSFERSVFVNCPFDEEYVPILQAITFCISDMGFVPRLAPENGDSSATRLDRIVELIRGSKYGIHDLSRCKSAGPDEYARMNMPFELGMDYSCRKFGPSVLSTKSIMILENIRYEYQRALSDIAGWDIYAHGSDHIVAVRHVSSWLARQAQIERIGPTKILDNYAAFQEWYWERELAAGASEEDIRAYPTIEMVDAMQEWVREGRPC